MQRLPFEDSFSELPLPFALDAWVRGLVVVEAAVRRLYRSRRYALRIAVPRLVGLECARDVLVDLEGVRDLVEVRLIHLGSPLVRFDEKLFTQGGITVVDFRPGRVARRPGPSGCDEDCLLC